MKENQTMTTITETSGFSLADFAGLDTTEVKELTSLLPPAGIFAIRCTSAILGANMPEEGAVNEDGTPKLPLFNCAYKLEVLEAQPLDKTLDAEKMVGRALSQRFTFWPSNFEEQIGLLKGMYKKVGLPNAGKVGGMEGGEPGWIDGAVEHLFKIRIRHGKVKGSDQAFFDWVGPIEGAESSEAAA